MSNNSNSLNYLSEMLSIILSFYAKVFGLSKGIEYQVKPW